MALDAQEKRIGTLLEALRPVSDISKNWGIDLAQHLETYLEQIALDNGMNFTEAALLIQNSAVIYVKKVDYVWEISQQLLESLRKRKVNEDKAKRRQENDVQETEVETGSQPNKKETKKNKDVDKSKYGEINTEVSEKQLELEPSKQKRKPWKLVADINHQFLKRPLSNRKHYVYKCNDDAQEDHLYIVNHLVLSDLTLHHELYEEHPLRHAPALRPSFFVAAVDEPAEMNDVSHYCDDNNVGPLTPPPSSSENTNTAVEEMRVSRTGPALDKVVDNVVKAAPALSAWDPIPLDETGGVTAQYPEHEPGKKKTLKLPDKKILDQCLKRKADGTMLWPDRRPVKTLDSWLFNEFKTRVAFLVDDEYVFMAYNEMYDKATIKRREKKRKGQRKFAEIRHEMADDFNEFDDFLGFEDYEPTTPKEANGFPGFCDGVDDCSDDDCADDDCRDNNCGDNDNGDYQCDAPMMLPRLPDEDEMRAQEASEQARDNRAIEALVACKGQSPGEAVENHEDMALRVQQWHELIKPAIARADQRTHFNIHEYGTRIIDSFPSNPGKHTLQLQQIVQDVDTQDVARYFVAMLQLANSYNIEISTPKEMTMDRIECTLLSARRFHEDLNDYVAPSQEQDAGPAVCTNTVHMANTSSTSTKHTRRKHKLSYS